MHCGASEILVDRTYFLSSNNKSVHNVAQEDILLFCQPFPILEVQRTWQSVTIHLRENCTT